MDECIKVRRTGRSTALALQYIADSYNRPRFTYIIKDHLQHGENHVANRNLLNQINEMVNNLGLNGFVFNRPKNTLEYRGLCNCEVIERSKIEFPCGCKECEKAKN